MTTPGKPGLLASQNGCHSHPHPHPHPHPEPPSEHRLGHQGAKRQAVQFSQQLGQVRGQRLGVVAGLCRRWQLGHCRRRLPGCSPGFARRVWRFCHCPVAEIARPGLRRWKQSSAPAPCSPVAGAGARVMEVSMSPAWMPKRCSWASNRRFRSSPCGLVSGRLNQLTLYTSRFSRARRSRATTSSKPDCPPCALSSTSLRTPAAATLSPISVHSCIRVLALSVRVPANAACSGLKPTACVGKNRALTSGGMCGRAWAMTPSTRRLSTHSGRCGPCCSVAATGSTAISCALRPWSCAWAKSRAVQSAQKWDGVLMGAS